MFTTFHGVFHCENCVLHGAFHCVFVFHCTLRRLADHGCVIFACVSLRDADFRTRRCFLVAPLAFSYAHVAMLGRGFFDLGGIVARVARQHCYMGEEGSAAAAGAKKIQYRVSKYFGRI